MLDEEFVTCVEKAEKENNMSLVTKANALKRKSEEKTEEIKKLEEALKVLEAKRKLIS